jgi:hypothetical protein
MSFYHLPFGHAEWHVDSRDPAAKRPLREASQLADTLAAPQRFTRRPR